MHPLLADLLDGVDLSGDPITDAERLLLHYGCNATVAHSRAVAEEAARLAERYASARDVPRARLAGWLHDVSAVIPNAARLDAARSLGLGVLPEEERLPMILHQRLAEVLAREGLGVADAGVLSAVGHHTTLHARPSTLDLVVFVADKVAWDQPGEPPYLEAVRRGLERSLLAAACAYLAYMWSERDRLPVLHPWLREAYLALCEHQVCEG